MKLNSKKPVSVPQPDFATSFMTKKWLPSMPVWLADWYNGVSSAATILDSMHIAEECAARGRPLQLETGCPGTVLTKKTTERR